MEVITYALRDGQRQSDQYYRDVAAFTDEVLTEAEGHLQPLVAAFQIHLQETDCETLRTFPESTFELLTLGVLWRVYAGDAVGSPTLPRRILTTLADLRRRVGPLKPGVDLLRGVLMTLYLLPNGHRPTEMPRPTLENLDRLLSWLAAAGDFRQEVERLRAWRDFLSDHSYAEVADALGAAVDFADWFEVRSKAALGRYTRCVERFLAETHPNYRWQEDAIFCGRQRVEYHMNMVGTEILNRVFRETFLNTARKVVILPPCMRARWEACKARPLPFGDRCAGCTPGCRVHQLTKLGEKHGFEVLLMPHELGVFSGGATAAVGGNTVGVVGVSCPLTNAPGGWEMKDLGVPAQGVLLDYCGCVWHWHKGGSIPTDVNFGRVLEVLGIDDRGSQDTCDKTYAGAESGDANHCLLSDVAVIDKPG